MKGYIVSILIVGLALGGMGLGTFAWFTDTETMEANEITTGEVDLVVSTNIFGQKKPMIVTNLVPSKDTWTDAGLIFLYNKGTVPLKWQGHFVKTGGDLVMDEKLQFRFTRLLGKNYQTEWEIPDDLKISESENMLEEATSEIDYKWTTISSADNTVLNSGNLGGTLGCRELRIFKVQVKLDENAGNCYAGKTAKFNVVFDATQTDNPGWSETSPTQ
ncbi:hypothetical protein MBBA_0399 [Methanoculleus bourgensis]|uniref:TasA family protein n=1 Tax=Methanoculleus bourgensis TaxID=83986 RepID=UPI0007BCDCB9|nr:hypothetical protein MBBA_0399 [Methanoculleus bourgensis]